MNSYGLKPWNEDDQEEGKAIAEALAKAQEEEAADSSSTRR